jgi:hypothetical protein
MMTQFNFDATEFEKLDTLGDKALDQVKLLRSDAKAIRLDVCENVRKITPVIKTVHSIICGLKFVPGLKQACKALDTVIPVLDSVCPAQTERA